MSDYWGGDIPWYSASNMTRRFLKDDEPKITRAGLEAGSRLAPPGATLILVRGSGLFNHIPICFADAPVAFNQDVKAICPREGADPLFLHFWIESLRPILKESIGVTGIGAGKFDLSFLQGLPFPDLPIERQEVIGKLAASFDRKIELNRRMNATLEAMARALFRDWFVDFGPTRARMEGRPPYLAPELWSLFPDRLDDQGKPEGWEVSEIGKETTAVGGSTPSTKEPSYWGGDINWATPKDLSTLKAPVLLETSRTITEAGLEKISSGLLPEGTVLLSSRAPIGYVAIAAVPVAVNQGFIALKCGRRLSKEFVWQWLHAFMEDIKGKANGSTFQEISKKNFRPIPVVVPSEEVLQAFDAIVSPALERIIANERESRTLARTRDLLLPRLMSGELRVAEAGKIVEGEV